MPADPLTPEEWRRQCAARYMERAGVNEHAAIGMAQTAWELATDDNGGRMPSPQEVADEDMAYWENDE